MLRDSQFTLLESAPVQLAHRAGTVGPKGGIRMMLQR
jgi:hypothetical protein